MMGVDFQEPDPAKWCCSLWFSLRRSFTLVCAGLVLALVVLANYLLLDMELCKRGGIETVVFPFGFPCVCVMFCWTPLVGFKGIWVRSTRKTQPHENQPMFGGLPCSENSGLQINYALMHRQ